MSSDNEYSDNEYYDDEDDLMLDDEDGEQIPFTPRCWRVLIKPAGSASEMDVDTFDADYRVPGKGKQKLYEVDFDSLSQADVVKMMKSDVESISGICGVDVSTVARPLTSPITYSHRPQTSPALRPCCSDTLNGTRRSSSRSSWTTLLA